MVNLNAEGNSNILWGISMRAYFLLFLLLLGFEAAATDIATETDLSANSTVSSDIYTLNSGTYAINGQLTLSAKDVVMDKADTVLAITNPTVSDHKLRVRNFTIDDGDLTLQGANANRALHLVGDFIQNGGTVTATGSASNGNAIMGSVGSTYRMTGGTLAATAADSPYGTCIAIKNFVMSGGDATFQAGGGYAAFALNGNETTMLSGGRATFLGGAGQNAIGLFDTDLLDVSGDAEVYAKGGIGSQAFGIQAGDIVQTGGLLVGEGGDGSLLDVGIVVADNFDQQRGTLRAVGGTTADSIGVYFNDVYGTRTLGGRVELERLGAAASLYSESDFTFRTGATLAPIIGLDVSNTLVSGLIEAAGTTVTIDSGVNLAPALKNTALLSVADGEKELLFLDASGGAINGEFTPVESVTLAVSATKKDGDKYYLTVSRKAEVRDLLNPNLPHRNGNALIDSMHPYVSANRDCPLGAIWDDLESCTSIEALHARAKAIGQTMTPHAYTDYTHSTIRMMDTIDMDFSRQMQKRLGGAAGGDMARIASGNSLASISPFRRFSPNTNGWRIWAAPLYQQSSRFRAKSPEFEHAKEKFWGISTGLARDWQRVSLGLSAHYLRGDYDTTHAGIDSDSYGMRLGVLVHNLVPCAGAFNPWLQVSAGYDHSRLDQKNIDYLGSRRTSKPKVDAYRASMELGNDIHIGEMITLTPKLGVDYTHIRQGGYRERGASAYLLTVRHDITNSLRPRAGLRVGANIGANTELSAWGYYRFETLDTHSSFTSTFVAFPDVRFRTMGENRSRSSGNIGAGIRHRLGGRAELSATYDMTLESRYMAHRFGIGVGTSF